MCTYSPDAHREVQGISRAIVYLRQRFSIYQSLGYESWKEHEAKLTKDLKRTTERLVEPPQRSECNLALQPGMMVHEKFPYNGAPETRENSFGHTSN